MLKSIIVLFLVISSLDIFALDENYSIKYSKYIAVNSSFDVSLITSKIFPTSDEIRITVTPDSKTILNKVEFRNDKTNQKIPFTFSNGSLVTKAYLIQISLKDSVFSSSEFFQILFTFKSESNIESQIKFEAEFFHDNNLLGDLFEASQNHDQVKQVTAKILFYKPQNIAGNCLELTSASEFEIDVQRDSIKNLLLQFWFKCQSQDVTFLKVLNDIGDKTEFDIKVSKYQMLEIHSLNQIVDFFSPFFISSKSWNYLTLHFSFEDRKIYLYCNSILVAKLNLSMDLTSEAVGYIFQCSNPGKIIQIEQLRMIDYRKEQIKNAFSYLTSTEFGADSSDLLLQFGFNDLLDYSSSGVDFRVKSENIKITNSDAPLYPSSPNLKINFFTHYNEIEWQGGDYKMTDKYILDRSINGAPFSEIYSVIADNESEKIYSFIDQRETNSGIIYYRIKTINKDGSIYTSEQLKVGQGDEDQFNLIQNYPNPFNPKTTIEIELFVDSDIDITIYSIEGKLIQKIYNGFLNKGKHKFDFDASELSSGIYLYKVATPVSSQVKKMLLTK